MGVLRGVLLGYHCIDSSRPNHISNCFLVKLNNGSGVHGIGNIFSGKEPMIRTPDEKYSVFHTSYKQVVNPCYEWSMRGHVPS